MHPSPEVNPVVSDRIKVIRVLAILLVTIVHLQPGLAEIDGAPALVEISRFVLINVFGYASVPILSIISGWLMVKTFVPPRRYKDYITNRFQSLYLPLFSWSVIMAILVMAIHLSGQETNHFDRLLGMPLYDSLLAISSRPINYPLYFLRDIFVLSLFAPPLLWLGRRMPIVLLALAAFLFAADLGRPVLIRPMTFLFFAIGIVLATSGRDPLALDRYKRPLLILVLLFWAGMLFYLLEIRQTDDLYQRIKYLDLVNRAAVAITFWLIADQIQGLVGRDRIHRMERRIYLVFLSHVVVITIVGGVFKVLLGGLDNYAYLLLLIMTPAYCYLAGAAIFFILGGLPTAVQIMLMGKPIRKTGHRVTHPTASARMDAASPGGIDTPK